MPKKDPHPLIIAQKDKKVNTASAKTPQNTPKTDAASSSAPSCSASIDSTNTSGTPTDGATTSGTWVYSDTVKDHFLNPRNFLMGDESAFICDATGLVGNPICGDQMKIYLKIDPETDTITDIRWKTYGCASAIASTSALSELAKGKTLDAALNISAKDIDDYLGTLPKHKFHCSVLGHDALKSAIENYRAQISNQSKA